MEFFFFFGAQVTCYSNVETHTYEEKKEDRRFSQVQYVCLVHSKKFTRIQSSKLPCFPFLIQILELSG